MGHPRRRFPGGSVGQFFLIRPPREDNGDAEQVECFLTEHEAMEKAQQWATSADERVYVAKYVNHVDPENNDA